MVVGSSPTVGVSTLYTIHFKNKIANNSHKIYYISFKINNCLKNGNFLVCYHKCFHALITSITYFYVWRWEKVFSWNLIQYFSPKKKINNSKKTYDVFKVNNWLDNNRRHACKNKGSLEWNISNDVYRWIFFVFHGPFSPSNGGCDWSIEEFMFFVISEDRKMLGEGAHLNTLTIKSI